MARLAALARTGRRWLDSGMLRFWRRSAAPDAAGAAPVAVVSSPAARWRVAACALLMVVNAAVSGLLLSGDPGFKSIAHRPHLFNAAVLQ